MFRYLAFALILRAKDGQPQAYDVDQKKEQKFVTAASADDALTEAEQHIPLKEGEKIAVTKLN